MTSNPIFDDPKSMLEELEPFPETAGDYTWTTKTTTTPAVPIAHIDKTEGKEAICVELPHYADDEITITVDGDTVTITAEQDQGDSIAYRSKKTTITLAIEGEIELLPDERVMVGHLLRIPYKLKEKQGD